MPMKKTSRVVTSLLAGWAATVAQAAVDPGANPELSFTLWDPIQQASYTKDLGITANEFFNYAQANAGYQTFITIDATDPAFAKMLELGTSASSLRWLVEGVDSDGFGDPGDFRVFTTLKQGSAQGVTNPLYTRLNQVPNGDLINATAGAAFHVNALSNDPSGNPYNFQGADVASNGSGFYRKGQKGYLDPALGLNNFDVALFGDSNASDTDGKIMNKVGNSSWFYMLTNGSYDSAEFAPVDEFDNGDDPSNPASGHDGYWGFIEDPSKPGTFVLSYTLQSALLQDMATTALGRVRASQTEYLAGGAGHLISTPTVEFSGYLGKSMVVSPIPEPSTWAMWLSGLGLALVARHRRRSSLTRS